MAFNVDGPFVWLKKITDKQSVLSGYIVATDCNGCDYVGNNPSANFAFDKEHPYNALSVGNVSNPDIFVTIYVLANNSAHPSNPVSLNSITIDHADIRSNSQIIEVNVCQINGTTKYKRGRTVLKTNDADNEQGGGGGHADS